MALNYLGFDQVELSIYGGGGYPPAADIQTVVNGLVAIGATWVRIGAFWEFIEATFGTYDFSGLDAVLQAVTAAGITPLVCITNEPSWTPTPAAFGALATALAQRYAPGTATPVRHWEIWNEPNSLLSAPPGQNPAGMYLYQEAAYGAIKAVDTGSFVLSAGLLPAPNGWGTTDAVTWLQDMYALVPQGTSAPWDGVGFHPYSSTDAGAQEPVATQIWLAEIPELYQVMVANGDSAKPLWFTEFGFETQPSGAASGIFVTAATQAAWLVEQVTNMVAIAAAHNIPLGPMFIYNYRDSLSDDSGNDGMGVVTYAFVERPSWSAIQQLIGAADTFGSVTIRVTPVVAAGGSTTTSGITSGGAAVNVAPVIQAGGSTAIGSASVSGWSVTVAGTVPSPSTGWWWVDELDCLVYLSGSGQLSAVAFGRLTLPVNLGGPGTLSSDAYAIVPAAAVLSGPGTLSAAAYAIVPATAVLTSLGRLSATAIQRYQVAGALSGPGTLTVSAIQQYQRAFIFSSGGTLSATAVQRYQQAMTLGGLGSLTAAAIQQFQQAAGLSGVGSLASTALQSYSRSGVLSGVGSLSCTAVGLLGSVSHDATGGGNAITAGSTSPAAITFTCNGTAGATAFVAVALGATATTSTLTWNVTYGGNAMTQIGATQVVNFNSNFMALFQLQGIPGGTQTVSIGVTNSAGGINTLSGDAVTFTNVGSIGTLVTASGTTTSPTVTATCPSGGAVFGALVAVAGTNNLTMAGFSQTQRYAHNGLANTNDDALVIGDTITAGSSETFSVTPFGGGVFWCGMAVPMSPA